MKAEVTFSVTRSQETLSNRILLKKTFEDIFEEKQKKSKKKDDTVRYKKRWSKPLPCMDLVEGKEVTEENKLNYQVFNNLW